MEKLKNFVIVIDGKPFIKGFDRGEIPDLRADFKWNKIKCRRFNMADAIKELVDSIFNAIQEAGGITLGSDDLIDAIDSVVNDLELSSRIGNALINAHGYPELSDDDIRNILRGIVDNKVA